jgi:hypothetical protein
MIHGNCLREPAMTDRKMFPDMDADTRRFYAKIISTAMCNIYAVEHDLFDTLFCESDDPTIMDRWLEIEPAVMNAIQNRTDTTPDEASPE